MAAGKRVLAPILLSVFLYSKTSGNFDLSVESISISAGLNMSFDPTSGHLTIICSSCNNYIDSVRVHISGGRLGYDLLGLWVGGGTSRSTVLIMSVFRRHAKCHLLVGSCSEASGVGEGQGPRTKQTPSLPQGVTCSSNICSTDLTEHL